MNVYTRSQYKGLIVLIFSATVLSGWTVASQRDCLYVSDFKDNISFVATFVPAGQVEAFARLEIRKADAGKKEPILIFRESDGLTYMRPTYPDQNRVLTMWEGGSHVRLVIFSLSSLVSEHPQTLPVLDIATEYEPDILSGGNVIVVYSGKVFMNKGYIPAKVRIYSWNGEGYVVSKEGPWSKRFELLRQM